MSCATGKISVERGKIGESAFNATASVECGVMSPIWESSVMTVGVDAGEIGFGSTFGSLTPLQIFGQDIKVLKIKQTNLLWFEWVYPAPDYPPTILVRFNDYSDDPFVLTGGDGTWNLQVPQAFIDWLTALDGLDTPFEIALSGEAE